MIIKTILLIVSGKIPKIISAIMACMKVVNVRKAGKKDGYLNQKEKIELFDVQEKAFEKLYAIVK